MEILIKSSTIVDWKKTLKGDLYIRNGVIVQYGEELDLSCPSIDGRSLVVMPSFIDLHSHFREPGYTYKENLYTGSMAALKGGYTFVNLMANTNPVVSSIELVDKILEKAQNLDLIDIHQVVSVTKNFDGKSLDHLENLDERVKFISDDGFGIQSSLTMYRAMVKAREKGLTLIVHEEDRELVAFDSRLAENLMTIRDLYLSSLVPCKLHFAHISTKEVVTKIRGAKEKNPNITCEVTPHHILLSNHNYKVNPPIRDREDVEALIEGLKDGTIDIIATDHAPHSREDKEKGAPGISGLETAFSIAYTQLVRPNKISLNKLSQLMSYNPAKLANINKGEIKPGYDGDVVLVDLNKKVKVDGDKFLSKGKNTPFNGREFYGEVIGTLRKGEIKYNGGLKIAYR